jgi:hypothetical protein
LTGPFPGPPFSAASTQRIRFMPQNDCNTPRVGPACYHDHRQSIAAVLSLFVEIKKAFQRNGNEQKNLIKILTLKAKFVLVETG